VTVDSIKCNDGIMRLEIINSEVKGSGQSKHTEYHIKGQDSIGEIDIYRRFSEFLQFKDLLFSRYPGLYVPPIPPKKNTNNRADFFVEERKYFLDQFLNNVSSGFLASTPEM